MKNALLSVAAIALMTAGASLLSTPAMAENAAPHTHAATATASISKVDATKAALRDLWIGHVFWVRNVVDARLDGDKAAEATAEKQVVANAQAIAAAIEPFYGAAAKDGLFKLLAGHYGAVKSYLDASVAKDNAKQDAATEQLLANAEELAVFLSGANPHLEKGAVSGLLQAHGSHHISQIQQFMAKDYAGEAETWAAMSKHMYVIADALGDALAKQFPEKFK